MIPRLQKYRNVETHHATHDESNRHDDRRKGHCKAGVRDEGVEDDTNGFATRDNGEAIKGRNEEQGGGTRQTGGEDGEQCPDERSQSLEGYFGEGIL